MLRSGAVFLLLLVFPVRAIPVPEDWYPIQVGATWTYRCVEDGKQSVVRITAHEQRTRGAIRVRQEHIQDGKGSQTWVEVRADGVWLTEVMGQNLEPALCRLRLPLADGDRWNGRSAGFGPSPVDWSCSARGEPVRVPAGLYRDAVRVEQSSSLQVGGSTFHSTQVEWYAPNVGLVKAEINAGTATTRTIELVQVRIPRP